MQASSQRPHIAAIVAAAGLSRRMGAPKQLLPWGAQTVIAAVVTQLRTAGAEPVLCITGHRRDEVEAALAGSGASAIFNADYATGEMISSYQTGIRALVDSDCAGTLIALGDQPHIPSTVIAQVIAQAQQTPAALVIPSYAMRRGHPFYVPRGLWPELLTLRGDETLRTLVQRHNNMIVYVSVETDAILRDMDTVEEFAELIKRTA
jgi:molybdenum cofactor cytidylyltransferase